jgi:hypothetical protein
MKVVRESFVAVENCYEIWEDTIEKVRFLRFSTFSDGESVVEPVCKYSIVENEMYKVGEREETRLIFWENMTRKRFQDEWLQWYHKTEGKEWKNEKKKEIGKEDWWSEEVAREYVKEWEERWEECKENIENWVEIYGLSWEEEERK